MKFPFDKHQCNVDQVLDKYLCIVLCIPRLVYFVMI